METCKECNTQFQKLSASHLRTHGLSFEEYTQKHFSSVSQRPEPIITSRKPMQRNTELLKINNKKNLEFLTKLTASNRELLTDLNAENQYLLKTK